MSPISDYPKHWRTRAETMRALAEDCPDGFNRTAMLRNALDYDAMALRAEQRSQSAVQNPANA